MTRSELIARLATQFQQLTAKDAELSVKAILEGMSEALVRGDRIEIRGFGTFALNYRLARSARNPSTGATVPVPAKRVPHFTPGKELRERVEAGHDGQERTRRTKNKSMPSQVFWPSGIRWVLRHKVCPILTNTESRQPTSSSGSSYEADP